MTTLGAYLLDGHKSEKCALGVFVPAPIDCQGGLRVGHAGRNRARRLVVQHIRLPRLLRGPRSLNTTEGTSTGSSNLFAITLLFTHP